MKAQQNNWEQRYQQGETGWDRGLSSPALQVWLEKGQIRSANRVLIPGCGYGHEVIDLAKRDVLVTAIDIAPSAVKYLKQALQRLPAEQANNTEVLLKDLFSFRPKQSFDVIYEQTCLCAIEPMQRQAYATCLAQWLKPGGVLLAQFMQTSLEGGPPFHCDVLQMRQLFSEQLWDWPQVEPLFVPHRNGRFELGYVLRRR